MSMAYTSTTLLLAVLLCVSAVKPYSDISHDGICKYMVETQGYVTTKDGYILGMQRIPVGRSNKTADRPPVLLQHGLLEDATTWLLNSPDKSLAFILADNGFDVWLANTRGTIASRGHTSLSANDPAYWDWTWVQLFTYDLTAMYEYVHNQTGQKLYYVGHSLGTLEAFVSFSEEKLLNMTKSAALLGPNCLYWQDVGKLLEGICHLPLIDCDSLLTVIGGPNCCINPSTIAVFFDHFPQSSSTKNLVHLSQMIRKGNIAMYDYISESENTVHYRQPTPLLYNMTRIPNDIPLFISYGGKDTLSDVNDVQLLLDNLKDHQKDKLVVQYTEDYAHFDFIMAENANRVVYDPLMAFFGTT
uniref:Partial AB-hydrolase lipase domain-containing protein n=1 Tax=Fagus sylvatica TaxID=28930 RepID=A0A2N9ESV2_FAGSY